jgi:purine nucleosidase
LKMRILREMCGFAAIVAMVVCGCSVACAQTANKGGNGKEKVILDTDIGDDIDDAFALGLVLQSPELNLLGVSTAWGDTLLRARLVERLLRETGHGNIPVAVGIEKHHENQGGFSQAKWAEGGPALPGKLPNSVDFVLDLIKKNPGQITLIAIGPLTNLGAMIDRDPATFRKVKRVVIMGGSVEHGFDEQGHEKKLEKPIAEYNIGMDPGAAQNLFGSGVDLYMMPLDSTQNLRMNEEERKELFAKKTPLTNALEQLYKEWAGSTQDATPTLFDVMAVVYTIQSGLCPTEKVKITLDAKGVMQVESGKPNANACLHSDPASFFKFLLPRLEAPIATSESR